MVLCRVAGVLEWLVGRFPMFSTDRPPITFPLWLRFWSGWLVGFPMFSTNQPPITLPLLISKVLFWGIVIPTLIKAVTLTYVIIDIYIICINITSK